LLFLAPRCEGCIGVGTAEQVSAVPISVWGTVESCSVVLVMKFRRFPVSRGKASYHRKNSMRHRTYLLQ
ncbi:hypothetical protein, partial [Stenotrophomonas maltophilia]|uniref:hypothetical protein n=1 Tax=Stenotrophomonas maltophilia TaxID=40324 RepID=UPI001952A9F2